MRVGDLTDAKCEETETQPLGVQMNAVDIKVIITHKVTAKLIFVVQSQYTHYALFDLHCFSFFLPLTNLKS